jgi:hypothetical protein
MRRKIQYIILTLFLSSCATKKNYYFTEGETIIASGVMIEEANSAQERYFITCHQILDSVNILENLRFKSNVGSGIYLHKAYSAVIKFMKEDNEWTTYKLRDENEINAILVEISYAKLDTEIRLDSIYLEIPLKDSIVSFEFEGSLHRINHIRSLIED